MPLKVRMLHVHWNRFQDNMGYSEDQHQQSDRQ